MLGFFKRLFCIILRLPGKPSPPSGRPGTLKVFRASSGFIKYRFFKFFGLGFVNNFVALIIIAANVLGGSGRSQSDGMVAFYIFTTILVLYLLGLFISSIIGAFGILIDYDFRWYQVTDRSLRIREGVFRVREMTVTFDNIQEVSIEQGPLQRFFGIADVTVRTAGGKNPVVQSNKKNQPQAADFHKAVFRGVSNADEIRDLIQTRVRNLQSMGIGESKLEIKKDVPPSNSLLTSKARRNLLCEVLKEAAVFREKAEYLAVNYKLN